MLGAIAWLLTAAAWLSLALWVHGDFAIKAASTVIAVLAFAVTILSRRRFSGHMASNIAIIPVILTTLLLVRIAVEIGHRAIYGYGL